MLAFIRKHFCYYPVVFQIKCVFEKKFVHIYLYLINLKEVAKYFDKVALKCLHITQQIILITRFQILMFPVGYVAEEQKWISQKRLIKTRSVIFKILTFEILATTKWCSSPTYTNCNFTTQFNLTTPCWKFPDRHMKCSCVCIIENHMFDTGKTMSEMLISSFLWSWAQNWSWPLALPVTC